MVSFETSDNDTLLIMSIVIRGMSLPWLSSRYESQADMHMDIAAVHANGNPLRLDDLLAADDFNFAHDMLGICEHLNRETGKLDGFRPRFSQPYTEGKAISPAAL